MENDILTADEVNKFAEQIKDNWTLCEFMANNGPRASEKEMMIAQTIHAARINLQKHGEPFSFRGDGVFSVHGGGLADNATAYGYLVSEGYFKEGKHKNRVVIFPTKKLGAALTAFFNRAARAA